MILRLQNIVLPLADFALEIDVSLTVQVTAICGASGSGKTSLLDLIAGLRWAESAFIQLGERVLTDTARKVNVRPQQRQIGYVPQDLALFPHLSVQQNLLFGHRLHGKDLSENSSGLFSFEHVVEVLEIGRLTNRTIANLSGGEKQRVALGRALLTAPRLLLLDEPLANLDRPLKAKIVPYLIRVRDEFRLPILYVTHDLDEVQALCEQTLFIERGRIV